jgi:addiction module HigA family antidote
MADRMTNRRGHASDDELFPPVHPGEILKEEFLVPYGLTQHQLALATGMPPQRVGQIVLGKRAITADTALRLARFFDTTPEFWLNLQAQYELDAEARAHGQEIEARVPWDVKEWICMDPNSRRVRLEELCESAVREGWRVAAKTTRGPRGKRAARVKYD